MNMTDPLGLQAFTDQILGSITSLAPVALIGLVVILSVYGLLRR